MDFSERFSAEPLAGPFRGQSMNCAACHLVDQQLETPGGGMRTYADFAGRSPIPGREDGKMLTPRNSPPLVNSTMLRDGEFFLHFDGEFGTIEDLVLATLTGRNFGWLPAEREIAKTHVANVVRFDDGLGALAGEFEGISYGVLLKGEAEEIPEGLRLPPEFRVDVATAGDAEIIAVVSRLIGAYVDSLIFLQDESGAFNGSPYDVFLRKNGLPSQPNPGESALQYSRRLAGLIRDLGNPAFVGSADGAFRFHGQEFRFGPEEFAGLKVFFREPEGPALSEEEKLVGGIGNCLVCHTAPTFTDFGFHNTGVTEKEFEDVHGAGAFAALFIPDYFERSASPETYLTPTFENPSRQGVFLSIPVAEDPLATDLGVWNVLGHENMPKVQEALLKTLCAQEAIAAGDCTVETVLPLAVARFKTPGLRDLGHSAPYMHDGRFPTLEDVAAHYSLFSGRSQATPAQMRNAPKEFLNMALEPQDLSALVAFLRALNEDYE
jgi:cytochrome c peroxidase